MIKFCSVTKKYSKQTLFDDVSFNLSSGERVGLIGRNGSGKSTLLKLILKEEEYDSGDIIFPKNYTIGHLSQHLHFTEANPLNEAALGLPLLEGDWRETYKAEEMLGGLGFSQSDLQRPIESFSGGYQIRINLAKLLLSEPNLLLLDEPTNYLDIVSIRWLKDFLTSWPHELILITHDREFMDSVTTHSMIIHREKVRKIPGPSVGLIEMIGAEEEIYEKTRLNEGKKRAEIERYISRFSAQATKAKSVQSRVKALNKLEVKEKLNDVKTLEFEFNSIPFPGKWMMEVNNLSFRYGEEFPWLVKDLTFAMGKKDRIGIIGPNGRGKTTLLRVLGGELEPVEGTVRVNSNTKLSHFGQTNITRLNLNNTVERELIETHPDHSRAVARNIAGLMMFEGDSALKKISVISGGERSRVLLGKILISPTNLLLLDEPTNHLDMESIDSLVEAIDSFPGGVLLVTHSELLLRALATRLIIFDGERGRLYEGTYDDFLERVGWGGISAEGPTRLDAVVAEPKVAKEEVATPITPTVKENSKVLQKLERKIVEKEKKVEDLSVELEAAANKNDIEEITKLSKDISYLKLEIEKLFSELDLA